MRVAVIQLQSGSALAANLKSAGERLAQAAAAGAALAVLPENFAFMAADEAEKRRVAEPEDASRVLAFLATEARRHQMAIVGGTVTLTSGHTERVRNACPVFSSTGEMLAVYDKMHLFDVALPGESWRESAVVEAGTRPVMCDIGDWRLGLSICYDLRFPELYRHYSQAGCRMITVPAAFTETTGRAHWEVLLRARAIENQCYVLAAAQGGCHPGGRRTWGHAMIVDPWGEVLDVCRDTEGIVTADISHARIDAVRRMLPALGHRRL